MARSRFTSSFRGPKAAPAPLALAALLGLAACGDGAIGEARLQWVEPEADGSERTRDIDTWVFMTDEGSRFGQAGLLLHSEFELPDAAHGQLQLDLPREASAGEPRGTYRETVHGDVVFNGVATAGGLRLSDGGSAACDCAGGVFWLHFVDPGPDAEAGTSDDLTRVLRDGSYHLGEQPCTLGTPPEREGSIVVEYTRTCGTQGTAADHSRSRRWDRSREPDPDPVVVVVTPGPAPRPPAQEERAGGCSGDDDGGGCSGDDDGGGCGGDDAGGDAGGGCGGDDAGDDGGGGCGGDDAGGDGGGGCAGDDDTACRAGRRRLSGGAQSCLFVVLALLAHRIRAGRGAR